MKAGCPRMTNCNMGRLVGQGFATFQNCLNAKTSGGFGCQRNSSNDCRHEVGAAWQSRSHGLAWYPPRN